MTTTKTPSPTGLYWSATGRIECAEHTPYEGSDTWVLEQYAPVPLDAVAEADAQGMDLCCEVCGAKARRVLVAGASR